MDIFKKADFIEKVSKKCSEVVSSHGFNDFYIAMNLDLFLKSSDYFELFVCLPNDCYISDSIRDFILKELSSITDNVRFFLTTKREVEMTISNKVNLLDCNNIS